MREFLRIFVWGTVAVVSLMLAIFAGSTEAGSDRARHAALQMREVFLPSGVRPARPLDAIEGRKLAETVRLLTADRERLLGRIAALESNVDDITGSIKRVEKATRPVPTTIEQPFSPITAMPPQKPQPMPSAAPPAQASPAAAWPPSASAPAAAPPARPGVESVFASIDTKEGAKENARDGGRDDDPDPATAAPETKPSQAPAPANPVTRRQFGLDLGGAASEEALRPIWSSALRRHAALLQGLRPLVLSREHARGGVEYRLIAGPIGNAAKAARYCAAITATGGVCQPTVYDGQKFASH